MEKIDGKEVYFNEYRFNERFHFVDLEDGDKFDIPKGNAIDYWLVNIDQYAKNHNCKVIFIDNLMSIINEGGIESSKEAAPILKGLLTLKKDKGYTIIVVHHTVKRAKAVLTRNDMAGSSNFSNLIDSLIGIDFSNYDLVNHTFEGKKENLSARYIIQLKPSRLGKTVYGRNNVITARISKIHPNFTGYELIDTTEDDPYRNAEEHITNPHSPDTVIYNDDMKKENMETLKRLITEKPEASYRDLENEMKNEGCNLSHVTIGKYAKQIQIELNDGDN